MKICIISDSHDSRFLVAASVADAKARGAEHMLHCADVVAPTTLRILNQYALAVHVIHGNKQGDTYAMGMLAHDPNNCTHYYGQQTMEFEIRAVPVDMELATNKQPVTSHA